MQKFIVRQLQNSLALNRFYFSVVRKGLVALGLRASVPTGPDLVALTERQMEESLQQARDLRESTSGDLVLLAGSILHLPNVIAYVNHLKAVGCKIVLLAENEMSQPSEAILPVPTLLAKDAYCKYLPLPCSSSLQAQVDELDCLRWAKDNLMLRHPDMDESYATYFAATAWTYLHQLIEQLTPSRILLWNQFYAFHHIAGAVCKQLSVPLAYMEYGVLPGTLSFDSSGQMGESEIARNPQAFAALPVSLQEREEAEQVCRFLYESRLNRNRQSCSRPILVPSGRPVLFYAGQNDFESGMIPYTQRSQLFHSPVFSSSYDALLALSNIAQKHNWTLLFKEHPLMTHFAHKRKPIPSNVILVGPQNINTLVDMSDVVVTILSQVGYVALIRDKATVMMGYTQLKQSGCTYEAFCWEDLEQTLCEAVAYGRTLQQRERFLSHTARLLKYYLFDDASDEHPRYGLSLDKFVNSVQGHV